MTLENNIHVHVTVCKKKDCTVHRCVHVSQRICAYCYIVHVVCRRKTPSQNQ